MVLEPLDTHLWGKNEPADIYLTSHIQINLKWITDLNIKAKTNKVKKKTSDKIFTILRYSRTSHKQH